MAIERELFGWCRHPIQYRERSDRMPALNQRFKSSCDYRVPASGRFARGTVLGGDHVGVLPHSTDFSHSLYREVVLMTSLHSNRPFLSNTLMEHHPKSGHNENRNRGSNFPRLRERLISTLQRRLNRKRSAWRHRPTSFQRVALELHQKILIEAARTCRQSSRRVHIRNEILPDQTRRGVRWTGTRAVCRTLCGASPGTGCAQQLRARSGSSPDLAA